MAERWNPWRAMRAHPDVTFARRPLPPGVSGACVVWPDETVVLVDSALDRRERNVVLAHELVHLERGVGTDAPGAPTTWTSEVAKEEATVDRIVASRLVPLDDLAAWTANRTASDIPTTALDIAEHYDTTEKMAELAALLLKAT